MGNNQNDENHALDELQEELSLAALHAVVARVGGTLLGSSHKGDAMGVDETALFRGNFSQEPESKPSVAIHFQVKATRNPKTATKNGEEYWVLYVKIDQLQKYLDWGDDLILAFYVLPPIEEQERWLEIDDERIVLRRSLFWISLVDFKFDSSKSTNAVYISKKALLTPEALRKVVTSRAERKVLAYAQPEL